jgi:hypothetical protein
MFYGIENKTEVRGIPINVGLNMYVSNMALEQIKLRKLSNLLLKISRFNDFHSGRFSASQKKELLENYSIRKLCGCNFDNTSI